MKDFHFYLNNETGKFEIYTGEECIDCPVYNKCTVTGKVEKPKEVGHGK